MSNIAITTSQNVNVNFKIASVGDRMLAFAIDMLVKIAYAIVLYIIVFKIFDLGGFLIEVDFLSIYALWLILLLPFFFYTLVSESLMEGQTLGKKALKIKVVKIDGYQAHFGDYLMRWFFRLIDVLFSSGVVGILSVILTKRGQRLGDIVAGTSVISLKNNINISHTILENIGQEYRPQFGQVIAFSDNDMRIIKDNFRKAVRTRDYRTIHKLSEKIQSILNIRIPEGHTEMSFIETIIKDYNFYTGMSS
ncbi:MAG: RDD family protein [Capnocytophaga sp.]|nr:RDD family protein [Capnocytophaga sp.]